MRTDGWDGMRECWGRRPEGGGGRNMVAYCLEVCICIHKLCTMSLLHLGDNEYCPSLKLEYELETCVCTTPVLILST